MTKDRMRVLLELTLDLLQSLYEEFLDNDDFGDFITENFSKEEAEEFGQDGWFGEDDEDPEDPEDIVAEWARDDYDNGKPVEDYTEFSRLCEDMDIEPTPELYRIYLENCCYPEEYEEEDE